MGYLGVGFVLFAVISGAGGSAGARPVLPMVPAMSVANSPSPMAAPVSLSPSPVLTQLSSGAWTTTVYLNTAALCPERPSFELVTTSPNLSVPGRPTFKLRARLGTNHWLVPIGVLANTRIRKFEQPVIWRRALDHKHCGSSASRTPLTRVQLTFGPSKALATPPVMAAVVVTPALPTAAPLQINVTVHRWVSWSQYVWIPLACGVGLAALLVATMLAFGLPDPNPTAGQHAPPVRGGQFWSRPLYAAAAWTFSGSWATNITAGTAVIAAVLAATGTVSELLPGVELGRFSLLIVIAGAITGAAPLVFGALNYKFARVDPTTAGVSVITPPEGPVAVLKGRLRSVLLGWRKPGRRYGGMVVILSENTSVLLPGGEQIEVSQFRDRRPRGNRVTIRGGQEVTVAGRGDTDGLPDRKAVLPDKGKRRSEATIALPSGATITVSGGITIPPPAASAPPDVAPPDTAPPTLAGRHQLRAILRQGLRLIGPAQGLVGPTQSVRTPADVPLGAGPQAAGFTKLPTLADATLKSGAVLSVPPDTIITVSPTQPGRAILALPGASDIAVFPGQRVRISPWATVAAADVIMMHPPADATPPLPAAPPAPAAPWPPGYVLGGDITLPSGAKLSFLGRASLTLPAGTLIAAPGAPCAAAPSSFLKTTTVFPLPHTSQVIASQMWSLLLAACLTLFGTGAELGLLSVLAISLSSADFTVRAVCAATAVVAAAVVLAYSVVAIRALADPRPGDAVNTTGGTSFML